MTLSAYRKKRTFRKTPEPRGEKVKTGGPLTFVVQKHEASRLHYDFRLELGGTLKSWAVPKGPSMNPDDKRLAMMVEDHPLEYASFEGIIPKGNYGAGTVMVWDQGVYTPYESKNRKKAEQVLKEQLAKGHITFVLLGEKLKGEFVLIKAPRMEENAWLLMKVKDSYANDKDILKEDRSAVTHRTMDQIAGQSTKKNDVWHSKPRDLDLGESKKTSMPHEVKPMLAETAEAPFDKPDWLFELKWDGYRAVAEIESKNVKLYSRNLISYNEKFAPVTKSLSTFPADAVLDGEIVVVDAKGHPSFGLLQDYPESKGELVYYVFDLLYYDGRSLMNLPLTRRKEILKQILPPLPHVRFSDHVEGTGKTFFALANNLHLEGIIAKQSDSEYLPGIRSSSWLKIKTQKTTDAVIAGFTNPKGGRQHFGALVLGTYKRNKLIYIGHTGGGFDDKKLEAILTRLKPLTQKESPFETVPKTNAPVTWVKPKLICEVTFKEWTHDGIMRQPIFVRMRDDKTEIETIKQETEQEIISGKQKVSLTNTSKVFWPKEGYTKGDLLTYYNEIADVILPHLKGRPESLLRFPNGIEGESFFQKDSSNLKAPWIKRAKIKSESQGTTVPYLLCQDKASLLYIVNLGCIDFNPWSSRVGYLDHPDYAIIDLDPEAVSFAKVIEVATQARHVLEQLEITSFPKTSGKRGLHIYIPMGATYTYEQVSQFTQLLCLEIQKKLPQLVSLVRDPDKRQGKVYLDYLRNGRGQTAASVYSVRAFAGATVSTPLKWEEVNKKLNPADFTIKTIFKRLDKTRDLFKGTLGKGIDIQKILTKFEKLTSR